MKPHHLAATLMALGWMAIPTPAGACPFRPLDARAIADSEVVFVGTVEGVSDRVATIAVIEVWRGPDLPQRVDLTIGKGEAPGIGLDDRTFNVGSRYLFLPYRTLDGLMEDNCTLTRPWSDGLASMRPATARAPISPGVVLSIPLMIAIGLAVALTLIAFVAYSRARPAPPSG